VRTLRLRCECGKNIADVTRYPEPADRAPELAGLLVASRPGITRRRNLTTEIEAYRPPTGGAFVAPTYTWSCGCGRTHRRRHDAIVAAWTHNDDPSRRVVVVILDREL
jgi:hypothetical protein